MSTTRLALLVALCLLLVGCGKGRVTKENFDKIKNDMTLADVEEILKEGSQVGDGSMVAGQFGVDVGASRTPTTFDYVWERGNASITVTFNKQGKVVGKRSSGL